MKDEYLSSLVGRTVQVYKGGPDSNVGHLLGVNGDYLTLQKEDGEIVYYKTSHIKSLSEDSKVRFNSSSNLNDTEDLFKGDNFTELAVNFKDQKIRINGNGPESMVGHLIDANDEFLVIYTEQDGLIFSKQQHIKSISQVLAAEEETEENDNNSSSEEGNKEEEEELSAEVYEYLKTTYDQISAENTNDLLTNLKLTWVKVNRKGPESIEGMLVDVNEDFLVLVVNNEVLRIASYHVKNISVSVTKSDEQSDEQNQDNQNSNNQNSNQTSNNNNQSQQSYAIPYRRRRTGGIQSNPREQYQKKQK